MINEIKNQLDELGFNENETIVYLALTQLGEAPASVVAKKADLPRTTAISILNKLADENYLTTHCYKGITYYWVESPMTIVDSLANKMKTAEHLSGLLTGLYRTEAHFPFALVYDTKSGIKGFIEKSLSKLKKKSIIYTIDTPGTGNYAKIYSQRAESVLLKLKKKKEFVTKTLVPFGSFNEIAGYKLKEQNIELREMPREVNFKASIWLIDKMLVHFSGQPPFIAAIKHDIIVDSFKSIYDFIWSVSSAK